MLSENEKLKQAQLVLINPPKRLDPLGKFFSLIHDFASWFVIW